MRDGQGWRGWGVAAPVQPQVRKVELLPSSDATIRIFC